MYPKAYLVGLSFAVQLVRIINESFCIFKGWVSRFQGNSGVAALRNYEETEFSFHFPWCWGWGELYDTQAENSGKVAPGDPPPNPRVSLMRACLWKFEVGPSPESVGAALLPSADTWSRRLCAAARRGAPGGARSPRRAQTRSLSPRCGPGRHPRRGVWARIPSSARRR